MCNPGASSMVTQAAGIASSTAGSIFGALNERTALGLRSFYSNLNADAALDDAREVMRQAAFAEQRLRLDNAQTKSKQRAAMAANGVDLSTGSALNRLVSSDFVTEADAGTIRANAAREAAGYRSRASNFRADALMAKAARKGISPFLAGFTSLMSGVSKLSSDWYRLRKEGAFENDARGSSSSIAPIGADPRSRPEWDIWGY